MQIVFWVMFLVVCVRLIYLKMKLNKAYDCICYLTGNQKKKKQKNRILLIKLKDLMDDYKHGEDLFMIMPKISETIEKIELDTNQSN